MKLLCLLGTHLVCVAPGIPWNLEEQRDIRSVLTLQSTQYKPYIPYGARRKQRNMPWGSWHPALSWAAQPPDVPMPLAVPRAITAPQCAPSRSHFGKH